MLFINAVQNKSNLYKFIILLGSRQSPILFLSILGTRSLDSLLPIRVLSASILYNFKLVRSSTLWGLQLVNQRKRPVLWFHLCASVRNVISETAPTIFLKLVCEAGFPLWCFYVFFCLFLRFVMFWCFFAFCCFILCFFLAKIAKNCIYSL